MKISWNVDEFKAIRYSGPVASMLEDHAGKIAGRAESMGDGHYAVGSRPGAARPQGRHRASVVTANYKAMRDNAKNNTLIKAMGSQ